MLANRTTGPVSAPSQSKSTKRSAGIGHRNYTQTIRVRSMPIVATVLDATVIAELKRTVHYLSGLFALDYWHQRYLW